MSSPKDSQTNSPTAGSPGPLISPLGKGFGRLSLAPQDEGGRQRPQYDPNKDEVDSQDEYEDGGDEAEDGKDEDEDEEGDGDDKSEDDEEVDAEEHDENASDEDAGGSDVKDNEAGHEDADDDTDEDLTEDGGKSLVEYKRQYRVLMDTVRRLRVENREKGQRIAQLEQELADLREAQAEARRPRQRNTKKTWPKKLYMHLIGRADAMSYQEIYKLCCREENMSSKKELVHPNLRLRGPKASEIEKEINDEFPDGASDTDTVVANDDSLDAASTRAQSPSDASEDLFVLRNDLERHRCQGLRGFRFKQLPFNVQANILKFVFLEEDKVIHCLSRLDPYMAPDEPVRPSAKRSGLPHRFHVSGTSCNITYATKPNELLALLLVCKEWYFMGTHAFYGLNTFAFSSLGEFAGFCHGIGQARRERIQHIELLWMGNQYRVFPFKYEGRSNQPKYTSRRTWDTSLLCEMPRLKSLTVHINETGREVMRRKYEPANTKDYMAGKTAGQPNFRFTRSLRTLQGLDYIHQLRGMEVIRFLDFEKHLKLGGRHPIRDWTFGQDVLNVTTLPKTSDKAEAAMLKNLEPVIQGLVAQNNDWDVLEDVSKSVSAFDTDRYPRPEVRHAPPPLQAQSPVALATIQEHVEMPDVEMPDVETIIPDRRKTGVRKRKAEAEGDMSDGESTPRVSVQNSRSTTTETSSKDTSSSSNDEISLVGSNHSNPIDVEEYRLNIPRPMSVVDNFVRAQSTASSDHLFVRQNSFDSYTRTHLRPPGRSWSQTSRVPSETPSLGREISEDLGMSGLYVPAVSPEAPPQSLPRLAALAGPSGTGTGTQERPGHRNLREGSVSNAGTSHETNLGGSPKFSHAPSSFASSQPSLARSLPTSALHFMHSTPSLALSRGSRLSSADEDDNPFKRPRKK